MEAKQTLLNNQQIMEEIKNKIKMKMKNNNPKLMGFSKSSAKREVHSHTSLPQETREASNKQLNSTPIATRKRTTTKPKLIEGSK